MAYDPKKAAAYNQLRQQGLSEDAALAQAGVTDPADYAVNDVPGDPNRGTLGPAIIGGGKVAGVDYEVPTTAELQASGGWLDQPIVAQYPVKANSSSSTVTYSSYTNTSTETVSGGGSTTITRLPPTPNASSQALQPSIDAKQAEINQFIRDNPSNFERQRQGLPLLSPEENLARSQQYNTLIGQRAALVNQQQDLQTPGGTSTTTVPNTTTTTTTVTQVTAATGAAVEPNTDPSLQQAEEQRLGVAPEYTGGVQQAPGGVDTAALTEAGAAFADEDTQAFAPNPVDDPAAAFANEDAQGFGGQPVNSPASVPPSLAGPVGIPYDDEGNLNPGWTLDEENNPVFVGGNFVEPATAASAAASLEQATLLRAQQQATLQQRYNQTTSGADWRVRIRLAPQANYLYRARPPGILNPLVQTDGVIFPYVPTIQTSYQAAYDRTPLTHSNYQGYFYKNSSVGDINITGTFTAQDTKEAEYLLAVIHFFRSATKMFYGKDEYRGAPPPLVELSGFGAYQFNNHPCLISNFQYSLPNAVDYIRVNPNNQGQNLVINRNQTSSSPVSTIETALNRISSLVNLATGQGVAPGAQGRGSTDLGFVAQTVSGTTQTTYVPTKIEITVTLLPVQTRSQVSQQFSLKKFAAGDLLRGGFW